MYINWTNDWEDFKKKLPHHQKPYSKRNWGNGLHSLCSYQGKLKPSIAHFLIKIFVPSEGKVLDPFSGVGTIPFEAALQNKKSYAFELSPSAFAVTKAKLSALSVNEKNIMEIITELESYIRNNQVENEELKEAAEFGFNKKISDYYHKKTLKEIILARRFFSNLENLDAPKAFVVACLLHILHGNRPYALSRRSHPLTPYAPTGNFEYKSLILKLKQKVMKSLSIEIPKNFVEGNSYLIDSTEWWPLEVTGLDAVITSPPFFDSTRFYMFNWIRLWFSGWSPNDFEKKPATFVDEKQKVTFQIYESIIRQSRERLKESGVLVFHLGNSDKCNMAERILEISKKWFDNHDTFYENVSKIEKHGIRDKGRVTDHTYLVLY